MKKGPADADRANLRVLTSFGDGGPQPGQFYREMGAVMARDRGVPWPDSAR